MATWSDYDEFLVDVKIVQEDDSDGCVGETIEVFEDEEIEAEFLVPDCENDASAPVLLGVFTEDFKENPLNMTPSSPYAPVATAYNARPPPVFLPKNVIVTVPVQKVDTVLGDDDDITMEKHVFHLPDGHQLFEQVEEVVIEQLAERGRGTGRLRSRGQGKQPRQEAAGPQWVRGDRLIGPRINDDDEPEDLREMMGVVNARQAARMPVAESARSHRREGNEEEWMDVDDGENELLLAGEENSACFEWSPMDDYQGEREQFLPQQTGSVIEFENAYGAFRHYWDDGILSHIVTQTNRYAAGLASLSVAFARDWYDTNLHEILVLFAFWTMLGVIRMPSTISCFTLNPLLQTNIFRKMFSRSRYEILCRALHFNDNSNRVTDPNDPLFCFGPILDHFNSRFMEAYIPSQNICIGEALNLSKNNTFVYIKNKTTRYQVKSLEICESSTGYLWSFCLSVGAGTSTMQKSMSTVLKLLQPLLDKGYTVFMDNCFNSLLLARFLKTRQTDCVGTLSAKHPNVPPNILLCDLKEGQFVACHSGDVVILAYQDKKDKIITISTYHGNSQGRMESETKPHHPSKYKPQVILDYKRMKRFDRNDGILEPYLLQIKKCPIWRISFFKRLLNRSISNSCILLRNSTSTPKEHLAFRLELVDEILRHHLHRFPKPISRHVSQHHWPKQIDMLTSRHRARRGCVLCSLDNPRHRAPKNVCSVCDVPLCLEPCFTLYHLFQ